MKTWRILPSSTINGAGVLRGSGLYNSLGRAGAPTLARPSLCALSALRRTSGGAIMTIPGGRAPPLCTSVASSVLGASASIMGRSSQATGLRPFALPRPDALSPRPLRSLRRAHKHGVCGGVDWGLWLTEKASRGEPPSRLKLGATGYGYLGSSTTPKLTAKRGQGLTQPERHTRRA